MVSPGGGTRVVAYVWPGLWMTLLLLSSGTSDSPLRPAGRVEDRARFRSVDVMPVADAKALGYSNNPKFVVDPRGSAYFAVRSKNGGGFSVALVRSEGPWREGMTFHPTWLRDAGPVEVSTAPQRPAAIALDAAGAIHMAWYGGSASDPGHQIRYARFAVGDSSAIEEESQPFSVPGFSAAPESSSVFGDLWQEHPAIAVTPDGTLHLAWEARDRYRTKDGKPRPGIAYATRSGQGEWSIRGVVEHPPYLEADDAYPSQSRPTLVADRSGTVHVLCYGAVRSVQQILYGSMVNGRFSGWTPVAPSAGDQRHVAAAVDSTGRLHVVWREGASREGPASVAVWYASLEPGGRWRKPLQLSAPGENASTPSVAVCGSNVSAAWVAWAPGAKNSEGQADNGYPGDNSTVEGRVEVAIKRLDAAEFEPAAMVDPQGAYPSWAARVPSGFELPPLLWTTIGGGSIRLRLAWWPVSP